MIKTSKRNINKIKLRMGVQGEQTNKFMKIFSGLGSSAEKASGMYQFVGAGFDIGSPLIHGIVPLVTNPKALLQFLGEIFEFSTSVLSFRV